MLAAFKLRAVPVNVNYRYGAEELRYLLADADARANVYHAELGPRLEPVRHELPLLDTFVRVDDGTATDPIARFGATEYEAGLAESSDERDFAPRSADDLYVLYTGGTTGMPKGVMWRHEDVFFGALGGGGRGGAPIPQPDQLAARPPAGRRPGGSGAGHPGLRLAGRSTCTACHARRCCGSEPQGHWPDRTRHGPTCRSPTVRQWRL